MKKADRRELTRSALIESAAIEFEQHGYAGAVLSNVSDRLGLTKGTVYFHFPTKALLAGSVIEHYWTAWDDDLEQARQSPDSLGGLRSLSRKVAERYRDDVTIRAAVRLMRERNVDVPSNYLPFIGWLNIVEEFLSKAVDQRELPEGLDVKAYSRQIVATVDGLQKMADDLGSRSELPAMVEEMWRVYGLDEKNT